MRRREFLSSTTCTLAGAVAPLAVGSSAEKAQAQIGGQVAKTQAEGLTKPKDFRREPFKRLVIMGESNVSGGSWLQRREDCFGDVLARLIDACQEQPIEYYISTSDSGCNSGRNPLTG